MKHYYEVFKYKISRVLSALLPSHCEEVQLYTGQTCILSFLNHYISRTLINASARLLGDFWSQLQPRDSNNCSDYVQGLEG